MLRSDSIWLQPTRIKCKDRVVPGRWTRAQQSYAFMIQKVRHESCRSGNQAWGAGNLLKWNLAVFRLQSECMEISCL